MVRMAKFFFVLSTFQVAGMMDPLLPTFCHSFEITLEDTKCVSIKAFQEVAMPRKFLWGQLVESELQNLLQNCVPTYFVYLMFTFHYDKPANGV